MAEGANRSLADKLNELFANVRPDVGHEYSNEQVAAAIRGTGVTISQSYIWQLRKGVKNNPTLKHLEALAGFFGVPAAYFLDTETNNRVAEQLKLLAETQARLADSSPESDVKLMAMRAGHLSGERRKQVMDLLDVVYRLEQAEAKQQDTQ
ncbi:hypothetical protein GCM10010317_066620 [Streptomyces mirabilis]|jgi:transcriptional regulator with XRE-family HTH domain|uniref:helix-turn-helix domain-containing protein n=1 Tax=Streptomyces mirabilis TaxID=68239 RepID=UPI00167E32D6|nr:helix-turn-helix transcriptional regulator [Streptomyces mirabilis]GHD65996.1 hypothetical protein GCM10010317_066620 [Streptomyces mirabilis]